MARMPRLLDVSVSRSARIPAYPGYPEFEPFGKPGAPAHCALSQGAIIIAALNLATAGSGTYGMHCPPHPVAG
jgi:hypothetical protein